MEQLLTCQHGQRLTALGRASGWIQQWSAGQPSYCCPYCHSKTPTALVKPVAPTLPHSCAAQRIYYVDSHGLMRTRSLRHPSPAPR